MNQLKKSEIVKLLLRIKTTIMLLTQERGRVHEPRVPLALQSVFLRGNRDHDINTSAPERNKSWWRLYTRTQSVKADVVAQQNERDNIQHESQKPKTSKVRMIFSEANVANFTFIVMNSRRNSIVFTPETTAQVFPKIVTTTVLGWIDPVTGLLCGTLSSPVVCVSQQTVTPSNRKLWCTCVEFGHYW